MDIEADVIEFRIPHENTKTLFVWDILPDLSEAFIYESIWNIFSNFGALYSVKLCQNAAVVEPGFYAIVKFFSAAQASKAQSATNGKGLFQKSPLKVRVWKRSTLGLYFLHAFILWKVKLCTRQHPVFANKVTPLCSSKCRELANHYLGFNGWSSRVITLQDISNSDETGDMCEGVESQTLNLKYGCIVELTFTHHDASCRGVGVAEEPLLRGPDPSEVYTKRGKLQKWAKDKALADAFRKVLLVLLSNGKVAVECRLDPDEILPDEDLEGVIKVNDVSWSQFENTGEEDFLSDLTLNVSH